MPPIVLKKQMLIFQSPKDEVLHFTGPYNVTRSCYIQIINPSVNPIVFEFRVSSSALLTVTPSVGAMRPLLQGEPVKIKVELKPLIDQKGKCVKRLDGFSFSDQYVAIVALALHKKPKHRLKIRDVKNMIQEAQPKGELMATFFRCIFDESAFPAEQKPPLSPKGGPLYPTQSTAYVGETTISGSSHDGRGTGPRSPRKLLALKDAVCNVMQEIKNQDMPDVDPFLSDTSNKSSKTSVSATPEGTFPMPDPSSDEMDQAKTQTEAEVDNGFYFNPLVLGLVVLFIVIVVFSRVKK